MDMRVDDGRDDGLARKRDPRRTFRHWDVGGSTDLRIRPSLTRNMLLSIGSLRSPTMSRAPSKAVTLAPSGGA